MELKDFEIMAPVGSRESLAAAIQAGADSIYFGIENLNMRARSANTFTIDDLREIARTCDEHGMKSYLTVNTIIYDQDIPLMRTIVRAAKEAGISAIIAADVAVMTYAREIGQEVHLSTQLNISNVEALRFYAQFADVVVLARELNLEQVSEIYRHICEYRDADGKSPIQVKYSSELGDWGNKHDRIYNHRDKLTPDNPDIMHAEFFAFYAWFPENVNNMYKDDVKG